MEDKDIKQTVATVSEQGSLLLPESVLKVLGVSAQGQVTVRLVSKGDHYVAEIEDASFAARSRNSIAGQLGEQLLEKMTRKYGSSPKRLSRSFVDSFPKAQNR